MGDSAGGTLALTLLRDLQTDAARRARVFDQRPEFMVLISPWATLVSDSHQESASDYLSVARLHMFAQFYAPDKARGGVLRAASPSGMMRTAGWRTHSPRLGYFVWYGEDEVFASDIREVVRGLTDTGAVVHVEKREAGGRSLHVWPLVSFFLASNQTRRLEEMRVIVNAITVMMS
jgi:acetyl esterase/lipase